MGVPPFVFMPQPLPQPLPHVKEVVIQIQESACPQYARQRRRVAQYEGAKFEEYIENLPCPREVWLHRTPGRTKAVRGPGGRMMLVMDPDHRGLPDFHGGFGAFSERTAVAFDAKRCETAKWSVSGLTTEQREHLQRVHAAGDAAGVWLRFCEEDRVVGDVWLSIDRVPETGRLSWAEARAVGAVITAGEWWTAAEGLY